MSQIALYLSRIGKVTKSTFDITKCWVCRSIKSITRVVLHVNKTWMATCQAKKNYILL